MGHWGLGLWQKKNLRIGWDGSESSDCGGINYCYWWFFSKIWPLLFVILLSYIILWLLKSAIKINGLGSCSIRLFNSFSFIGSWDGIYSEQMVKVLCRVAETAIACKWVLMLILFRGISFIIGIDTPPEALCLVSST